MSRLAQDPGRESGPGAVIGWGNMAVLAALVTMYALRLLIVPSARPAFVQQHFTTIPLAALLHLSGASVALAAGVLQLSARLRKSLVRHRWLGRAYVIGVLLGGPSGVVLATMAQGGLPARAGFAMLAVLWVGATAVGFGKIRAGDVQAHRPWMIRSYALCFAAVTLRLYLPMSEAAGIPFDTAYPTIAWLCWVPNLVVAEWMIVRLPNYHPIARTSITEAIHTDKRHL